MNLKKSYVYVWIPIVTVQTNISTLRNKKWMKLYLRIEIKVCSRWKYPNTDWAVKNIIPIVTKFHEQEVSLCWSYKKVFLSKVFRLILKPFKLPIAYYISYHKTKCSRFQFKVICSHDKQVELFLWSNLLVSPVELSWFEHWTKRTDFDHQGKI